MPLAARNVEFGNPNLKFTKFLSMLQAKIQRMTKEISKVKEKIMEPAVLIAAENFAKKVVTEEAKSEVKIKRCI